jgi:CheY-like chemotaxis protein
VLVVDDDEDVRLTVADVLGVYGAKVECASSASKARHCLRTRQFDVVLSDINMPGESGLDLLAGMRAGSDGERELPAAAITAFLSEEARRAILTAGFDMIISKPFDLEGLVSSVIELAQLRRSR